MNKDAPKYFPALITTACFGATGLVLTLSLGAWMIFDNKRRDARDGKTMSAKEIPTELLAEGPSSWNYRWHL